MEASGSGAAAAARVKAGAPPRLVAVQGTAGNGALAEQRTARLVVFLGIADDASSRVAAALLEHRSRGRVRAVSASAATAELDPVVVGSLAEIGVDLARCQTQPPSSRLLELADLVVVMGYDQLAPAPAPADPPWGRGLRQARLLTRARAGVERTLLARARMALCLYPLAARPQ